MVEGYTTLGQMKAKSVIIQESERNMSHLLSLRNLETGEIGRKEKSAHAKKVEYI